MWKDISTAPKIPVVGCRTEIIIGINAKGDVHQMFCSPNDPRGDDWLICDNDDYLVAWNPILWTEIPKQISLQKNGINIR